MRFNGLVLDKQNTLENNNMNSICNLHLKSFAVCFLVLFFVFYFYYHFYLYSVMFFNNRSQFSELKSLIKIIMKENEQVRNRNVQETKYAETEIVNLRDDREVCSSCGFSLFVQIMWIFERVIISLEWGGTLIALSHLVVVVPTGRVVSSIVCTQSTVVQCMVQTDC